MKKILIILIMTATLVGLAFANGGQEGSMVEELRIGTASMGGAYFPVGQGIANLINDYAEGLTMVPVVTEGGIQNPRLIDSGDVEFAITNIALGSSAYKGVGPYDSPQKLLGVAAMYPSVLHMFTVDGTGIESIADLKGKKIAVGPAGGGTIAMMNVVLGAYGLTIDDVVPSYLSYSDGFSQLTDGNVDAAFALAGYPTSGVMQAIATHELIPLQFDEAGLAAVVAANPNYTPITIPEDTYNLGREVVFAGQMNILVTQADMDDAIVTSVMTAMFDNLPEFQAVNNSARQITLENAPNTGNLPLHPAAAAYYGK